MVKKDAFLSKKRPLHVQKHPSLPQKALIFRRKVGGVLGLPYKNED